MVDAQIVGAIRDYLSALASQGVSPEFAVVFGSFARGEPDRWSDIDLIVVAQRFDEGIDRTAINHLWRVAARVDSRIEPIACGPREWAAKNPRAIIELARREGQIVPHAQAA